MATDQYESVVFIVNAYTFLKDRKDKGIFRGYAFLTKAVS